MSDNNTLTADELAFITIIEKAIGTTIEREKEVLKRGELKEILHQVLLT